MRRTRTWTCEQSLMMMYWQWEMSPWTCPLPTSFLALLGLVSVPWFWLIFSAVSRTSCWSSAASRKHFQGKNKTSYIATMPPYTYCYYINFYKRKQPLHYSTTFIHCYWLALHSLLPVQIPQNVSPPGQGSALPHGVLWGGNRLSHPYPLPVLLVIWEGPGGWVWLCSPREAHLWQVPRDQARVGPTQPATDGVHKRHHPQRCVSAIEGKTQASGRIVCTAVVGVHLC